ncbi:glyoxylate/hydroxypyruvate reductase A [Herbaspirillum sp. RV1423]|uniref:2-hydroxyacid dehydrogenase n=1 Tax=Herbaspirillum sp. RV1423 TaxID=1443993 RepID=UPI0004B2C338|nr:glyoxylate/hydroxypyruvate reductase A [Herbaspirillum sp. RV1423]
MRILFQTADTASQDAWLRDLRAALPDADVRLWQSGDAASAAPADYAVVWKPPFEMLRAHPELKAVFNLGAGVDAILQLNVVPEHLPLIRIDDGGMAEQMAEFAVQATLRYYRRLDLYEQQARRGEWKPLPPFDKADFGVGILGLGVLGQRIAESLQHFGFKVSGWSRTPRSMPGVTSHAGAAQLNDFLRSARVLVCMVPLTPETAGILNRETLSQLPHGAYLINLARGGHLVEADLPPLLASGRIAGATLDVFREEPLPPQHPFWSDPRIAITPHISALTVRDIAARQIAEKIAALQRGETVAGLVDRKRGY